MIHIIEPCCYEKQFAELITHIEGKSNVAHFFSNSDWDLNQSLPFLVNRTPGGEVTLCLVNVEQDVLDTVRKLLMRVIPDPKTRKAMDLISHLSLVTRGDNRKEVLDYLKGFGKRLTVSEGRIGFRCLTCANEEHQFVVQGSINQKVHSDAQMFTLTTGKVLYEEAYGLLKSIAKVGALDDWEEGYTRILAQQRLSKGE